MDVSLINQGPVTIIIEKEWLNSFD
jgi:D-Tyr-tRNAtyr deacylase